MGKTSHPTIAKYWSERAWHEQLGVPVDPRPVSERPWREVVEYQRLMQMEAQVRQAEMKKHG